MLLKDLFGMQFGGYEVNVLNRVAAKLGWAPIDYLIRCVSYTDMVDSVIDPNNGPYHCK
jgi:hypothetical protein